MAIMMDGKALAADIRREAAARAAGLKTKPGLAVVLVGDDAASKIYVANKHKACEEAGFRSFAHELPADTPQADVLALVDKLNADASVHGILVQRPMPPQIDEAAVFARVDPLKDVDCFNPINVGLLALGAPRLAPGTPLGVMELLRRYDIPISGRRCVVLGRSNIVGKPMAQLLLMANGTVTVCHSRTADIAEHTRSADILVAAVGIRGFVKADMVKPGATVIDVGIHREGKRLFGDAEREVADTAGHMTPVPGGIGPMTIAMLLKNCLTAYGLRHE